MNKIVNEDLENIYNSIEDIKYKFKGSNILITGCSNYIGYYLILFFDKYKEELNINSILAIDNFKENKLIGLDEIIKNGNIQIKDFDIYKEDIKKINLKKDNSFVIHLDSVFSEKFYRKYPIETIEDNILGLKKLLEEYKENSLKGFLFFSTSEIYGNPTEENIPTPETYQGNLKTTEPKSYYAESKRIGETICFEYNNKYKLPTRIVRTFNSYGPQLNKNHDIWNFAKAVENNEDIVILSDGRPKRTYCYISDAISGYLKVLLHNEFDIFNIGADKPEITVLELAKLYSKAGKEILSYTGKIVDYKPSRENINLANSLNRKSPAIDKAIANLDFNPQIHVDDGVRRILEFIHREKW